MTEYKTISKDVIEKCREIVIKEKNITLEEIIREEEKDRFISEFIKTDNLNNLYNMLEDEESKKLLIRNTRNRYIIAFNKDICHNFCKEIILGAKYPVTSLIKWIAKISYFTIIKKFFYPKEIGTWDLFHAAIMKQYYIKNVFEVKNDSIIFDIGAYKGDTAYYFSKNCQSDAKIYCFEPDDKTFDVLTIVCDKYKLNNTLQYNILFSDNEFVNNFTIMMGNKYIHKEASENTITTTVDHFILNQNIDRLDFIKMDVEGAELKILHGATETIKKLRPALAVAIYHGGDLFFEDFITVPSFLKEITHNYKYYLRSFIPWGGEVILYCLPK